MGRPLGVICGGKYLVGYVPFSLKERADTVLAAVKERGINGARHLCRESP